MERDQQFRVGVGGVGLPVSISTSIDLIRALVHLPRTCSPRTWSRGVLGGWEQAGTDCGSQLLELSPAGQQGRPPGSSLGSPCPYVVSGIAWPLDSSDLAF